jgi:hypothetical protein
VKTLNWAERFVRFLLASRMANEAGVVITDNGVSPCEPNRSTMWPPHRPHPHVKRTRLSHTRLEKRLARKAEGLVLGIVDRRLGFVSRKKLLKVCP